MRPLPLRSKIRTYSILNRASLSIIEDSWGGMAKEDGIFLMRISCITQHCCSGLKQLQQGLMGKPLPRRAASERHTNWQFSVGKWFDKVLVVFVKWKADIVCCGRNSVVECQLPKLDVVGSNPIARFFISELKASSSSLGLCCLD
jgi:hypothetical protein